jgi:DNA-directed RNA polymerase specialized sigma24 family protein
MKFWDEDAVEVHLSDDDKSGLALDFLRLSRWVVAKEVRSPAWLDREELVQVGVACCWDAITKKDPGRPRMRYFAQVVKNEARRTVARACRRVPEMLPDQGHEAPVSEIVEAIIHSNAGRTFPAIRDAIVLAHRMDRIKSRACVAQIIETAGRPGTGRAMARMLKEELA